MGIVDCGMRNIDLNWGGCHDPVTQEDYNAHIWFGIITALVYWWGVKEVLEWKWYF
jgi:hypothetical protein